MSQEKMGEIKLNYSTCGEMMTILQNPETETSVIISLLHNIEEFISRLNKDCQPLVKSIMNLNWLDRGPELVEVYKSFMLNLLSANVSHLKPFLVKLLKMFVQGSVSKEDVDEERQKAKMEEDFHHIHSLIRSLAKIVPMSTIVLFPLLEEMFPYLNKGVAMFDVYTKNILTITTYIPSMRKDILDLLVKQMLKLDLRSSRTAIMSAVSIDESTNGDEEGDESIFHMEVACDGKDDPKPSTSDVMKSKLASAHPMAGSLDAMMNLTFLYISETCRPKGKLNWEATKKLFRELLSSFDKFVLPSHSSNHVQFIMFYICSFKEELAVGFIDYLWKKVTDPNTQPVYRQIGACYIGSFLSRAAYISDKTAKEVLELMLKWLHRYLDQTSDQNTHADMVHHSAFYSICQAAFYIFCFKHSQFLERKKDHRWAESLNFQRLITCKLNPLRVCQPVVVQTFSSAARTHQLAFCDTVIERNNRYRLPVSSDQLFAGQGDRQLDSFFPFDPFLLPRSSSYIVPLYKEFQGAVTENAEEDSEDDDDFLPNEEGCSASYDPVSMSHGKSPMDFLHYGTSPGFQHAN